MQLLYSLLLVCLYRQCRCPPALPSRKLFQPRSPPSCTSPLPEWAVRQLEPHRSVGAVSSPPELPGYTGPPLASMAPAVGPAATLRAPLRPLGGLRSRPLPPRGGPGRPSWEPQVLIGDHHVLPPLIAAAAADATLLSSPKALSARPSGSLLCGRATSADT